MKGSNEKSCGMSTRRTTSPFGSYETLLMPKMPPKLPCSKPSERSASYRAKMQNHGCWQSCGNECLDVLHARATRNRLEFPTDEMLDLAESPDLDPAEAAMQSLDAQAVLGAIDQLPPEFREVVLLREIEEMSYREIAEVIGKPIGTVMSRLARARSRLQAMLISEASL